MVAIKIISDNRKSRFDYELLDKFEAGLVLMGSEVKSLRAGQCNLKDSYISFQGDEAFLQNAHISIFTASSYNNHAPERKRKLLLHRTELNQIYRAMREKGLSCIPTKIYFKSGYIKLEIALARGKKAHDKRDSIKKREADRDISRTLRRLK